MNVLKRIINSRKTVLALIPMVISTVAVFGFDATLFQGGIIDVVNGGFALLVGVQGIIDAANGSPSDGTVRPNGNQ